jgi:hypothetical protein
MGPAPVDADALAAGANQWFRKRFAMLRDSGVLYAHTAKQIQTRSRGFDVEIHLEKGKIVFPSEKAAAKKLLQFLNGCGVQSSALYGLPRQLGVMAPGTAETSQAAALRTLATVGSWPTASVPPLARDLPFASKPTTAKVSSLGVRRKIGHGQEQSDRGDRSWRA